ncbi:MAG TPA: biotin transporter BioY [Candidatus Omnitrophota bacterium]|jgi:biotin transport system substrate-specific component|nr:biotin transporter BioY [Candidatus Omnitrophota bacterium]HPN66089.1 biotin transporter BioY [Candidatus Omnitrophota bacterium]HRZ67660.1 biotin transporter BioY [Candidatus Omnitrophota bacterium]
MHSIAVSERFLKARYDIFNRRCRLAAAEKLALSFVMACAIALLAQVRIPLPWTPVPITGSTLGAVFAGVLLGNVWGGVSMLLYLTLGAAGLPVFTGFKGGPEVFMGPTAGYLLGFVITAFAMGYITDNFAKARRFLPMLMIMLAFNALILTLGSLYLGIWMNAATGRAAGVPEALWMGAVPFIPGDVIKSFAAAAIAGLITPKESYK